MMASVDIQVLNRLSMIFLPVLLMTLVKSVLFCVIVAVLIRVFRLASAGVRYVLWVSVVFFVVFIAIYTFIYPILNFTSLRISIRSLEESQLLSSLLLPRHDAWVFARDYGVVSSTNLREELKLSSESLHWSFWVVCVWIAGFVLCMLHTLIGRIGVRYIFKKASPPASSELTTMIARHAFDLGITREIKVIVSRKCRLPFTYGLLYPVLIVPSEAEDWHRAKLRAVIIHELAHIQRHDYFVRLFSRLVCTAFWFVPVVWIAHARLQLEQEKLCDLKAIQKGERPTVYARYMIDLARTARSIVLLSGIFILKGRNKMLMKRVTNVLQLKGSVLKGGTTMKAKTFVSILICVLAVLIIGGSCATKKQVTKRDYRFVSGTWINEDYNSHAYQAKYVLRSDGTWDGYNRISDTGKKYIGNYVIVDKWTDSEGNTWYKMHVWHGPIFEERPGAYELDKYSESGKVWEWISDDYEFPTENEIDESDHRYHIYHRQ